MLSNFLAGLHCRLLKKTVDHKLSSGKRARRALLNLLMQLGSWYYARKMQTQVFGMH